MWDDDGLRTDLRDYVVERFGDSEARADQLSRRPSFPAPLTESRPMRIWDRDEAALLDLAAPTTVRPCRERYYP